MTRFALSGPRRTPKRLPVVLLVLVCSFGSFLVEAVPLPKPAPTPGLPSQVATAANYDGSRWEVDFDPPPGPNGLPLLGFGRALAEAGRSTYENQTARNSLPSAPCYNQTNPRPNWGFESLDRDCVLRITIHDSTGVLPFSDVSHTIGISDAPDVNIHILVAFKEILNAKSYYTNASVHTLGSIAASILGHEHFYILSWSTAPNAPPWPPVFRGLTRFVQTIHVPEVEQDPSSMWYAAGGTGVNSFPDAPADSFCSSAPPIGLMHLGERVPPAALGYMFGLYWGFLYAHDGGMETLMDLLGVLDGARGSDPGSCNRQLPGVVTGALERAKARGVSTHADFNASWMDFAQALFEKRFSWGTPDGGPSFDWGEFLHDVKRPEQSADPRQPSRSYAVGAWGLNYTRLPSQGLFVVTPDMPHPERWAIRLFLRHADGTLEIRPLSTGESVRMDGGAYREVVFNAVHLWWQPEDFALAVAPA